MSETSDSSRARLFTAFGTVLFVDPSTGELRHGAVESSPANAYFESGMSSVGSYRRGQLVFVAGDLREPIDCYRDRCLTASQSQRHHQSDGVDTFELIPLERGLLALRSGGHFLSAIPDGRMMHRASVCSTWELFIASENWCTDSPGSAPNGTWRRDRVGFNQGHVEGYIVHPLIRMKSNRQPQAKKILIYGYTRWSHGRVYYDLCRHLHDRGYLVDILDWQQDHAEYARELILGYDFVMSALDGISTLVDIYSVPFEKIIAISHSEFDIRMLIEQKGVQVFEKFANYGVVSESLYSASAMRGISRLPRVVSLGVDYESFFSDLPTSLTKVGYATSMSALTYDVEWKRGHLAEAAARDAGLAFKVAGSTGNQISFHDMPDFYRSVDAVLTSSLNESGPLSVLEGAAAGRLVIGTPVGHFPLKAYQGGGIIAPIEAEKFMAFTAATLRYYKENPSAFVDKCKSTQEAARKFAWAHVLDDWIDLFEVSTGTNSQPHRSSRGVKSESEITKAVICDINWLSSYLANEHYYLIRILSERYGFEIIDSMAIDLSDESTIARLNAFSVLLIAYQGRLHIPMHKISAIKILKIDDLVSYDSNYDELLNKLVSGSDFIISPYAYVFSEHFEHNAVTWIPYSSGLEGFRNYDHVTFNNDPIGKILVSGSIAADRPLRAYASSLADNRIEILNHPGYHNKYDENSPETVGIKYYETLSKYLCCFCDGHHYRYVHLKNFEIASVGSLLLADKIIEKELKELGFIDGETCVLCDKPSFLDRVSWILDPNNRPEVDRIRRAGMDLVRTRHMTKHRAEQIDRLVDSIISDPSVRESKGPPELRQPGSASA
ncbi:glycosyltransferase [Mesorhizobium sp. CU2]|uniref:glycosyltransferase n=1 Tax=unclassified Mesorhizobium TaxID=325217 RepID=UPI00112CB3C5|nr:MULTISPECIES: glycosyltransferase [unclassified Mesorhizobium]TPN80423.1 glycosyltransferase [Mesorhizobium sp. CU3]TPO10579.1 glycosyltransferase [Mesorhizobium sp. CU2]